MHVIAGTLEHQCASSFHLLFKDCNLCTKMSLQFYILFIAINLIRISAEQALMVCIVQCAKLKSDCFAFTKDACNCGKLDK